MRPQSQRMLAESIRLAQLVRLQQKEEGKLRTTDVQINELQLMIHEIELNVKRKSYNRRNLTDDMKLKTELKGLIQILENQKLITAIEKLEETSGVTF